jgi:DNA-directed RNA polymerase subunit RPC12/RpoP
MVQMKNTIHCPFCTDALIMKDDHLFCSKGNCGFSKIVQDALFKAIASDDTFQPSEQTTGLGSYYCPKCCNRLTEDEKTNVILCEKCSLHFLPNVIYHLREHHFHTRNHL